MQVLEVPGSVREGDPRRGCPPLPLCYPQLQPSLLTLRPLPLQTHHEPPFTPAHSLFPCHTCVYWPPQFLHPSCDSHSDFSSFSGSVGGPRCTVLHIPVTPLPCFSLPNLIYQSSQSDESSYLSPTFLGKNNPMWNVVPL